MPYNVPGVYVEEQNLPNIVAFGSRIATGAFIGTSDRGPTTPTKVEGWTQFVTRFGGFGSHELHHSLFAYFSNGGRVAYVTRVVGSGAVASDLDVAGSYGAGAPSNSGTVFTISAANPGAWGDGITVAVTALADRDSTFDITVNYGGSTVETWRNLSFVPTHPRYFESIINSVTGGSTYISIAAASTPETTVAAGGEIQFAQVTSTALADGAAGSAPDSTAWADAVASQDAVEGPFLLNMPGISDSTIVNNAIAYAAGRTDVFVIVDPDAASSQAKTVNTIPTYTASSFAAVYYPRLIMQDPSSTTGSATRISAPGGAMMGQFVATDAARGVFKTPAGTSNVIAGAIDLEHRPSTTEYGTLHSNHINAFRRFPGTGIVPYGGRTLKRDTVDQNISARRSLIFIERQLNDACKFAAFEPNDEILWSTLRSVGNRILGDFWRAGGLKGRNANEAYFVVCDESNNTPQTLEANEVHLDVGVALQRPAEFVIIRVGLYTGSINANTTEEL